MPSLPLPLAMMAFQHFDAMGHLPSSFCCFTFARPDHCWVNVKLPQLKFVVSKTTRMVTGPLGKPTGLADGIRRKTDQSFKGEAIPVEDREPRFVPMGYSK